MLWLCMPDMAPGIWKKQMSQFGPRLLAWIDCFTQVHVTIDGLVGIPYQDHTLAIALFQMVCREIGLVTFKKPVNNF